MHYLAALRSGVSVEAVACEFAKEFVFACNVSGDIRLQFICDFINDTLLAIGLECDITPEQLEAGGYRYVWPKEQMQVYVFQQNHGLEFRRVEQFLLAMLRSLAAIDTDCYEEHLSINNDEERETETPIESMMRLVVAWYNVYRHLLAANDCGLQNMFIEPLARINCPLFEGMHGVRVAYRQYFPLLDKICDRLFRSAVEGLSYPLSHEMVFQPLLKVVSRDFDLFPEALTLFLYEACSVEYDTTTYEKVFQELQDMLENNHDSRLNSLTNVLITPHMMQIYFHILVKKRGKRVIAHQQLILQFLNILQSKLLSLDSFSRDFMESILNLVTSTNCRTSARACKLYIDMMKRKQKDEVILIHSLQFYANRMSSTSHLADYISQFYNNFELFRDVYNIFHVILSTESSESLRLISAHAIIQIFKIRTKDPKIAALEEIQSLLLILPEQVLVNISCQITIGILLQLFEFVSFAALPKQTIDNFIYYAVDAFKNLDNKFEYPLLMNIFTIFHKCLKASNEWQHLEFMVYHLMNEFRQVRVNIISQDQQQLSASSSGHFCDIVKRINIIIKTCYEVFDYLPEIMKTLEEYILTSYNIRFIGDSNLNQESTFIDLYALEVVVSCIIKLSKQETEQTIHTSLIFEKARVLSEHLIGFLRKCEQYIKLSPFRMKAYFCSLLNLFCHLPLKISTDVYHHMTQILICLNFVDKPPHKDSSGYQELQQRHPVQGNEYVRVMFQHFIEIHKYPHVEIKSNIVWKLCLHYGKPFSKYNEDIKHLLVTLATHRFKLYKHTVAVLVYNLYREQPPLNCKTILALLRNHKDLIHNEMNIDAPNLLKVHIVLLVLQLTEKSLKVQSINDRLNRLVALQHLNVFTEGLDLRELQADQLIVEQLDLIKRHLMTSEERKMLDNYRREVFTA